MTSDYRMRRLTAFLDPWADPAGSGYHPIQSMLSFAQGGVTGSGLGQSVQKYHVPEETTDFILPVLSEELGFAGVAAVVGLYLLLLWAGLAAAGKREDAVGRLLCLGVVLMIATQAAINLAVVTVVVPTKGIALPLRNGLVSPPPPSGTGMARSAEQDNEGETQPPPEDAAADAHAGTPCRLVPPSRSAYLHAPHVPTPRRTLHRPAPGQAHAAQRVVRAASSRRESQSVADCSRATSVPPRALPCRSRRRRGATTRASCCGRRATNRR